MMNEKSDNSYKHLQSTDETTLALEISCTEPAESEKEESTKAIIHNKPTYLSRIRAINIASIQQFVIDNFIPVGFAIILIFSVVYPFPGNC